MTTTTHDLRTELEAVLDGTVTIPDDPGWAEARRPWDGRIDQQPRAVVHAASVADVQAAVRVGARLGVPVAAQPRGHGATAALDGTILLRTTGLDELSVDTGARTARIGAGVTWGEVMTALDGTGLVGLAGSHPGVTVVPYLLGGGLSWFSRAHGVAARDLRAADVVDASGELRRVDASSDPDLLWALRGGGGDLGVVTAVEVDLHEAPALYGGRLVLPDDAARAAFDAFSEVTASAPDELTTWFTRMHVPDAPFVPEEVRGRSFVMVDAVLLGDAEQGEQLLAPVRAAGPVVRDTVRVLRPGELGTVAEEPEDGPPPGVQGHFLGRSVRALDRDTGRTVLDGTDRGSRVTMLQVRHLGGALARPPRGDQAGVGTTVTAGYAVSAMAMTPDPAALPAIDAALGVLRDALEPSRVRSTTLTFRTPGVPWTDVVAADDLERLRELKRRLDPAGVIRSNHPVLED